MSAILPTCQLERKHVESLGGARKLLVAMQGALKALLGFMYQLEHLAVLFALLNTKASTRNGPEWRKAKYGRVIKLLEEVRTDQHFVTDMDTVTNNIWDTTIHPDLIHRTKQLSGPQLGKINAVTVTTACDRLDVMSLYVDTAADQKQEEAASSADGDREPANDEDDAVDNESQDGEQEDMATQDGGDTQEDAGIVDSGRVPGVTLVGKCCPAGVLVQLIAIRYIPFS